MYSSVKLMLAVAGSLATLYSNAATITATSSGSWSSNSTWSCSCQPTSSDNIIIPAGITVTASGPVILFLGPVITITINGTLVLNNGSLQIDGSDIIKIGTGGKISGTGLTGGSVYSGVTPMFIPNGSSMTGPKTITNGVLPVELLFFNGAQQGDSVVLRWASASELNFDYYEIARSSDGINFTSLGRVQSAGNSTQRVDYFFTDTRPLQEGYYRLSAIDADGSVAAVKTITIATSAPPNFDVYPNPVRDNRFSISMNFAVAASDKLALFSLEGNKVCELLMSSPSSEEFLLSAVVPGVYYVILSTASKVYRRRILIQ